MLGFVSMAFTTLYLYEILTHTGEYQINSKTLEQVKLGTVWAMAWCGAAASIVVGLQFFVSRKIYASRKKTNLMSSAVALSSWLLLFLPSAIQAYNFYLGLK